MSPFLAAQARILSGVMGEDALLRGTACRVSIEHGTAVTGDSGQVVGYRTLALIPSALAPVAGDALVVGTTPYTIDVVDQNDGYMTRCILL